jgi:hypothetical protein
MKKLVDTKRIWYKFCKKDVIAAGARGAKPISAQSECADKMDTFIQSAALCVAHNISNYYL